MVKPLKHVKSWQNSWRFLLTSFAQITRDEEKGESFNNAWQFALYSHERPHY